MSIRKFHFMRLEDASGVSGCGMVAEGVVFSNGKVALEWFGDHSSTNVYDSLADVEYIHGHGGRTKIVFEDESSECCSKEEVKRDGK